MKQFSLFFVCLGIVLLALGIVSRKRRMTERNRFYQTVGTLIDKHTENVLGDTPTPTTLALLTIRFITTVGQALDFVVESPQGSALEIGDEIRVYYDPAHPELATLSVAPTGSNLLSLLAISAMTGGVLCVLLGLFLFAASQG